MIETPRSSGSHSGGSRWTDYAAIAAIAAICYAGTLSGGFVFDDVEIIVQNPLVTGPDAALSEIFTSHYWQHVIPSGNLYRPLTILSYRLNAAVDGLEPAGYHAVNVILHLLCACLLLPIARGLSFGRGGALAGAAIFAAHPIHTEAVAGVVGRADLLAAAGVLGALALHVSTRSPGPVRTTAAAALLAAGLLSKESAVVLPAMAIAADLFRIRMKTTTFRQIAPAQMTFITVVAAWLVVRALVLPGAQPGTLSDSVFAEVPWPHQFLTALWVLSRYLQLLVAPVTLSADYSYAQTPLVTTALNPRVLIAAGALAAMAVIGLMGMTRRSSLARGQAAFCALAFLAAIAPVSNLIVPIGTIMAERLLYLPSMAFCLAIPVAWTLIAPRLRPAVPALLAALLVATFAARTIVRNRDWKDQLALFSTTVIASPNSARAHYNLGIALEDTGRPDAALAEYRIAMQINPDDAKPLRNAALLLAARDRTTEALALLEKAALIDPSLPGLLSDLGAVYSALGRPVEAEASLREALIRDPDNLEATYNLGSLLLDRGYHDEAIPLLARAASRSPKDPDTWFHLGLALLAAGRPAEAIAPLTRAEELNLKEAPLHLARALLQVGDRERAAASAARAREAGLTLPPELLSLLP